MFVLEMPANVSPEMVGEALAHYEKSDTLKELFPNKVQSSSVSINIQDTGVNVSHNGSEQGLLLQRLGSKNNPEISIQLENNLLTFSCHNYSRWNEVSEKAYFVFKEFLSFICPALGVSVIGLQYIDEFFVSGKKESFKPRMLLSSASTRIPSHILDQEDFWHSFNGWFDPFDDGKILTNFNISYHPQPEYTRNVVRIAAAHRYFLSNVINDQSELAKDLSKYFDVLHVKNKEILKELLTNDMHREIGLT